MSLEIRHLTHRLAAFNLLEEIDLKIEPGQVTAIVGPNGAGKSSLLRAVCGELVPSQGEVLLDGHPLSQWPSLQRARKLAVLPQASRLGFPFTAREVVLMGRTPHATGLKKDRQIADKALAAVDCTYLEQRMYTQMSGGEKQRVQLARVLAQIWDPVEEGGRYLIMDEPTAPFDLAHQQLTLEIIRRFADDGVGVVVVMHDLNLALRCARQLVIVHCGRIYARGSPAEVMTPANISAVFSVDVSLGTHPTTGRPVILA